MKEITVGLAIRKGKMMLTYPVFGIMAIGIGITLWLVSSHFGGPYVGLIGFLLTFIIMWFWWSFFVVKWKIWAFNNVRNVHALKRRAIQVLLIWPDSSWFNKTEIKTTKQVHQLEELAYKFKQEDILEKSIDFDIETTEIKVYISKISRIFILALSILILLFGIYIIQINPFAALISFAASIFLFSLYYNKFRDVKPQLIINKDGLKIKEEAVKPWSRIKYCKVYNTGTRRDTKWFLEVNYNKTRSGKLQTIDIELEYLNIKPHKIEDIINTFMYAKKQ